MVIKYSIGKLEQYRRKPNRSEKKGKKEGRERKSDRGDEREEGLEGE